jgi:hypothetical protein
MEKHGVDYYGSLAHANKSRVSVNGEGEKKISQERSLPRC